MQDYYKTLGVNKNATQQDIKAAYQKLVKKYHPDKATGDEKMMYEINEAYSTLSKAQTRREYDHKVNNEQFYTWNSSDSSEYSNSNTYNHDREPYNNSDLGFFLIFWGWILIWVRVLALIRLITIVKDEVLRILGQVGLLDLERVTPQYL